MRRAPLYGVDLAYVHAAGYGDFAAQAAPGLCALLAAAGVERGTVVELGSGAGAATRALVRAGHAVLGIDASPALVRIARARVRGARFVVATLPDVQLPACDAIVAVGEVPNYLPGVAALDLLFRRSWRALRPGGVLVFDVKGAQPAIAPVTRGRTGADWAVVATTTPGPRAGRLTRTITSFRKVGRGYRRRDEAHVLTVLPIADVVRRLRRAGFAVRVTRGYGEFAVPVGHAVLIARKAPRARRRGGGALDVQRRARQPARR